MAKYEARYRCQLCGNEMRTKEGKQTEVTDDQIPKLLARVVTNQQFIGTSLYQAPMYLPHKCPDGSGGLAAFIGFKRIQ